MKHSISPYPENVRVNKAGQVFRDGKYLGWVDTVENWGKSFRALPEKGDNAFFRTRTEAVKYILSL